MTLEQLEQLQNLLDEFEDHAKIGRKEYQALQAVMVMVVEEINNVKYTPTPLEVECEARYAEGNDVRL